MSVRVEIDELADRIAEFGATPFLLTTAESGRPHATHVVVALVDGGLQCGVGRKTAANAAARPTVSFLWPPVTPGGFSLIVDGEAEVLDAAVRDAAVLDTETPALQVRATAAVLHRNASGDGYEADCIPLDGRH